MQRVLAILTIFFLPFGVLRYLHDKTGNFRPQKIREELAEGIYEIPEKVQEILQQPFTYRAMGHHTYAFVSQDGKYVLKVPRYHKFRPSFWLKIGLLPKSWRESKCEAKKERKAFLLKSHEIAEERLEEETGLIYLHLNKGGFFPSEVKLIDGLNRSYYFDLSKVGFALQKCCTLYGEDFPIAISKKDEGEVREMVRSYLEVIASRYQKGVMNKDRRGWHRNYGRIDSERAYEIDLGSFSIDEHQKDIAKELADCSRDYRRWIEKRAPNFLPLFDDELKKMQQTYQNY